MNISKKNKVLVLSILGILGLIIMTVGVTYAFFNYAKEGTTENSITSGTITFLYTEVSEVGRGIRIQDAYPMSDEIGKVQVGEGKVFDFKITSNTSNSTSIPYEVTARKKSTSTLAEEAVKLYLTEVDGSLEEEVLLDNYSNLVQTTRVDSNKYIEKTIYEGKVPVNSINYEKNFRLRMWIDESTDFGPVKDEITGEDIYPYNGKEFTLTVNVYSEGQFLGGTLKEIGSTTYNKEIWKYKSSIQKIVFENRLHEIENAIQFDLSAEENNSVIGYLVQDQGNYYTAYIQGNGMIQANSNSSYLFNGFSRLTEIENLKYLDTSNVTSMKFMFNSTRLIDLDLSGFDTSKVVDMSFMFSNNYELIDLDLSSFDTSKVLDMSYMFAYDESLTNLDLSSFDTTRVYNMEYMFYKASKLNTTVLISNPNISKYGYIFYGACAATQDNHIVLNYTSNTLTVIDNIFNIYRNSKCIVKGIQVD